MDFQPGFKLCSTLILVPFLLPLVFRNLHASYSLCPKDLFLLMVLSTPDSRVVKITLINGLIKSYILYSILSEMYFYFCFHDHVIKSTASINISTIIIIYEFKHLKILTWLILLKHLLNSWCSMMWRTQTELFLPWPWPVLDAS